MSYINEISFYKKDRSEESNKNLAQRIATEKLEDAISELKEHLFDKNKTIASDCIAVLYHVGYQKPEMIVDLTETFVALLSHKNNRMVWGGMIALATISEIEPDRIETHMNEIYRVFQEGSLISQVWAYKTIANLSKEEKRYEKYIDFLLNVLESTRPIDFAKRALTVSEVIREKDQEQFLSILKTKSGLSKSASKTIDKIVKNIK